MSERVFIDTDIILDLLSRREPFYPAAAALFSLAERGEVRACVSSLCFANLFYILRKELSAPRAIKVLKKLQQIVTVLPVDNLIVSQALDSGFRDFEDALQYHAVLAAAIPCLVTRNGRNYPNPEIPVLSAEEFLAQRAMG
ncbi:PIN domain-containing protein [Geoalkalibacter sp.]|uniref:PIN domain-containing protein n=1 Tax=Geoalkalibacter sp. TaxID=3041440 RepID=UPI00272E72D9|nr:PIN domain-containing protein [Geoalkalibacter sp.]